MSLWNMPPGCMDASDLDYYERMNPPRRCSVCKCAEEDCECYVHEEGNYMTDLKVLNRVLTSILTERDPNNIQQWLDFNAVDFQHFFDDGAPVQLGKYLSR